MTREALEIPSLGDRSPGGGPRGLPSPLPTRPGSPNSAHIQLEPLLRIISIPCLCLTKLWQLPTPRPAQTSVGAWLLGRKPLSLPQPPPQPRTAHPQPWEGAKLTAEARSPVGNWQPRGGLLTSRHSANQESWALTDSLTACSRVCAVRSPVPGARGVMMSQTSPCP